MERQSKYPIKVLDRSFCILKTLLQQSSLMSISEISKKLKIYPSTIHRILDILKHKGYIEQEPQNKKFQLRLKLIELCMVKFRQIDLGKEAPFFKELTN